MNWRFHVSVSVSETIDVLVLPRTGEGMSFWFDDWLRHRESIRSWAQGPINERERERESRLKVANTPRDGVHSFVFPDSIERKNK